MVTTAILIAALAGMAASIAAWGWHQLAQIHRRVGDFEKFEGMHFER